MDYSQPSSSSWGNLPDQQNEFFSWKDLKYNDDAIDPVWLEEEHKRLDEKFGKGIVTVKFTEHNTLGYYCKLCLCTMNATKSLDMHCSGMKHLKKKDMYEKCEGGSNADSSVGKSLHRPPSIMPTAEKSSKKEYSPPADARKPSRWEAPVSRDYVRRVSPPPRDYDRWESPALRNYNRSDYPYSRDEWDLRERREYGLPGRSDPYSDQQWRERSTASLSPPPPKRPALESLAPLSLDKLPAEGPAAVLLMKLAQSSIKTEDDIELASDSVNLLLKSLKNYHQKLGEKNVADLMEQAEIKLGTAKALRTMKKLKSTPESSAISIAMETLRNATGLGMMKDYK